MFANHGAHRLHSHAATPPSCPALFSVVLCSARCVMVFAVWGPPRENPGQRPKDRVSTCDDLSSCHCPSLHATWCVACSGSGIQLKDAFAAMTCLGLGSCESTRGAASHHVESGGFGMTSCERSISWNTRSIRRKRPLCTFSTCPSWKDGRNKDVPIETRVGQAESREHFRRRQLLKTLDQGRSTTSRPER